MKFIYEVISNKSILVPALTWAISQVLKVLGRIIKQRKFDITRLFGSGGMPSAHSSFISCLTTVVGKNEGWGSSIFGIALAVSLIVMYDAAGIRRAAGNQARILNKMLLSHDMMEAGKELKELLGHSPFEVAMGAILGIFMGLILG